MTAEKKEFTWFGRKSNEVGCGAMTLAGSLVLALSVALLALRSYGLMLVWGWFVEPFGLPAISLLHAYGLMIVFVMIRGPYYFKADDDTDVSDILAKQFDTLIGIAMAIGFAYTAHSMM